MQGRRYFRGRDCSAPPALTIVIHTARPGVLIGVKGGISSGSGRRSRDRVEEGSDQDKRGQEDDTNAQIVAQNIARQLENRGSFRKAMKMSVANAIKGGARAARSSFGTARRRGHVSNRGIQGRRVPCTLSARISITVLRVFDDIRPHRREGLDLQGMVYKSEKNDDAGMLVRKQRRDSESRDDARREERGRRSATNAEADAPASRRSTIVPSVLPRREGESRVRS
jgi:small subunit ribosomal protein S3